MCCSWQISALFYLGLSSRLFVPTENEELLTPAWNLSSHSRLMHIRRRTFYNEVFAFPTRHKRKRRSSEYWQSKMTQDTLYLKVTDIQAILKDAIPQNSYNLELVEVAASHFDSLTARSMEPQHWHADDLESIISVMNSFVDMTPSLPPTIVGMVHSTIGKIRYHQRENQCAIESLLKALWIKNSSRVQPLEIGMALHLLGMAYFRVGNTAEACSLLHKALTKYELAKLARNHPFVVRATERIERYEASFNASSTSFRPKEAKETRGWGLEPSLSAAFR